MSLMFSASTFTKKNYYLIFLMRAMNSLRQIRISLRSYISFFTDKDSSSSREAVASHFLWFWFLIFSVLLEKFLHLPWHGENCQVCWNVFLASEYESSINIDHNLKKDQPCWKEHLLYHFAFAPVSMEPQHCSHQPQSEQLYLSSGNGLSLCQFTASLARCFRTLGCSPCLRSFVKSLVPCG